MQPATALREHIFRLAAAKHICSTILLSQHSCASILARILGAMPIASIGPGIDMYAPVHYPFATSISIDISASRTGMN